MKKKDLLLALSALEEKLQVQTILQLLPENAGQPHETVQALKKAVLPIFVRSQGEYTRLSETESQVAKLLGLSPFFEIDFQKWTTHWAIPEANWEIPFQQERKHIQAFLINPLTTQFREVYRRIHHSKALFVETLSRPESDQSDAVLELVSEDVDPTIDNLGTILRQINELAKAYCEITYPGEEIAVRVSYLDMGSNTQIGIKVDGKAEVGVNIAKILARIVEWAINPRAAKVQKEVELMTDIQGRVDRGEISEEAANLAMKRLYQSGSDLAKSNVFPASLVRAKVEVSPVNELMRLVKEQEGKYELEPAPIKLALPDAKTE